jgi:hypothetical protein
VSLHDADTLKPFPYKKRGVLPNGPDTGFVMDRGGLRSFLAAQPPKGEIRGKVLSSEGEQSFAQEDYEVLLRRNGEEIAYYCDRLGAKSEFSIPCDPGKGYSLAFSVLDGYGRVESVNLSSGQSLDIGSIRLKETSLLHGRIEWDDEPPRWLSVDVWEKGRAAVEAEERHWKSFFSTQQEEERYWIQLPRGTFLVRACADGLAPRFREIQIGEKSGVEDLDFHLYPGLPVKLQLEIDSLSLQGENAKVLSLSLHTKDGYPVEELEEKYVVPGRVRIEREFRLHPGEYSFVVIADRVEKSSWTFRVKDEGEQQCYRFHIDGV